MYVAARGGLDILPGQQQLDLLHRLESSGVLPQQTAALFHELRRPGNTANHQCLGSHEQALHLLRLSYQLAVRSHRTLVTALPLSP